jgi:hypothetical protein
VDVLKLFNELGLGEDVEVVVTNLPKLGAGAPEKLGGLAFEDADACCQRAAFWFGQEKMNMLGH